MIIRSLVILFILGNYQNIISNNEMLNISNKLNSQNRNCRALPRARLSMIASVVD